MASYPFGTEIIVTEIQTNSLLPSFYLNELGRISTSRIMLAMNLIQLTNSPNIVLSMNAVSPKHFQNISKIFVEHF